MKSFYFSYTSSDVSIEVDVNIGIVAFLYAVWKASIIHITFNWFLKGDLLDGKKKSY